MGRLGFEASGGQAACRWVAVRHGRSRAGNDHFHIVVGLVREDGKVARTANDFPSAFPRLCADMEGRYGLSAWRAGPESGDARAHPGRGLKGATLRTGRSGRAALARVARATASVAAAKPSSCGSSGTPGWRPGPVTTAWSGIV